MSSPETQKIQKFRAEADKRLTSKNLLLEQKAQEERDIAQKKARIEKYTKARYVISQVMSLTQQEFSGYVENLVTFALKSIYDRDLRFVVTFKIQRNQSECLLQVQEGENEPYNPQYETGGGLLDVISFALRIVMWSLREPRTRNVLFLDEPFKFIGRGPLLPKSMAMMKELAEKLHIQMIINTHIPELSEMADRAWIIKHNGVYCETLACDETAIGSFIREEEEPS